MGDQETNQQMRERGVDPNTTHVLGYMDLDPEWLKTIGLKPPKPGNRGPRPLTLSSPGGGNVQGLTNCSIYGHC